MSRKKAAGQFKRFASVEALHRVEVEWADACSTRGWFSFGAAQEHEPEVCTSVGWLVQHTKATLTLAMSRSGQLVGDLLSIPSPQVQTVRRLSAPRRRGAA